MDELSLGPVDPRFAAVPHQEPPSLKECGPGVVP
jgi:hypothetical protein